VFAIRGESVFTVTTNNQAEPLFAGLSTEAGASSHGVVLRDGRLAVVGPRGSLTLRGADGTWQQKPLPETKARFAGISEGETGLVITVDSACSGKDWLCNEPPARGCSAVGGPSVLALLLGLATLRRARRA
jgi:hypothetical protein